MLRYKRYYGNSARSGNPFEPGARETTMRSLHKSPHTPHPQKHQHAQVPPGAPERPTLPDEPEVEGVFKVQDPTLYHDLHVEQKVAAWHLLHRAPRACSMFVVTSRPSINAAAKRAQLDKRTLIVASLSELRPHDDHEVFLAKLSRGLISAGEDFAREMSGLRVAESPQRKSKDVGGLYIHPVPHQPQVYRYLTNEAEASETYFLNVLQPVMSVASQFIHWEQTKKGTRLELVLSSQYNVTEDTGKPSALDFIFSLVTWPPTFEPHYRFDLVVVELKRPGLVREKDWDNTHFGPARSGKPISDKSWAPPLLPQALLYSRRTGCERFFFSDYRTTVGVHVDYESVGDEEKHPSGTTADVHVGARIVQYVSTPKHPYDAGPSVAILYEIYEGMRALGIFSEDDGIFNGVGEYFDEEERKWEKIKLHENIVEFFEKHGDPRKVSPNGSPVGKHRSRLPVDSD